MSPARATAPAPGTRPPNRRELVRAAAADLFARDGFANVAMAEVAAAVNVGPSALYRHWSGKDDLLFDILSTALDSLVADLPAAGAADLPDIARQLATRALDHRSIGVLLQRESRHLGLDATAQIRAKRRRLTGWLTAELSAARPELSTAQVELLGLCAIDAVSSVSFHRLELPRPAYLDLLAELGTRVLALPPGAGDPRDARPRRASDVARADEILDCAVRLFAERGYAEVSTDDIGGAAGIAGPTIYHYFPSKQAVLVAAMRRCTAQLREAMRLAQEHGTDSTDALRRLTDAYVDLALDHPDLITVLITETVHLHDELGSRTVREVQRAYIADWVALAAAHRPSEDPTVTRIKVQAAQMLANDVSRTPRLRRIPGFRSTVRNAAWALQQ